MKRKLGAFMVKNVDPSGSSDKPYHAQYRDTPAFHKMWNSLFHEQLSKEDAAKMTDGYMKVVNDFMNRLANNAIQALKKQKKLIDSDYQDDGS